MLGTAYRTAWHLYHRIHEAMGNDPLTGPTLFGIVEVDETLIGGRVKGQENRPEDKTWVAGAIKRGGRVWIERIPSPRTPADTLRRITRGRPARATATRRWLVRGA